MAANVVNPTPLSLPLSVPTGKLNSNPTICLLTKPSIPTLSIHSTFSLNNNFFRFSSNFSLKPSSSLASVGNAGFVEEPSTNVKFPTSLTLPGCSTSLSLLGTGYREKVFAIIGVKVYAAGLYINSSVSNELNAWRGRSAAAIQEDSSLFDIIFQSCSEKSLQIVLVRDVDGKTFWDALDDAISPRIKAPTPGDESALSTFRSIFEGRSLKKGTFIFLTWLEPPKMLVSISINGPPTGIDATIESNNVTSALFDVFFGDSPVSSTLKASVATGLAAVLK
ncbi:fatty-acid-binding protein 3 [Cucumis melo var. makuwa]|uniref:Chalcone-flavonone isomerase family protein n=2 Tax=Cucumis melo TaxID=3656 RepID=A0A1S3BTS4_CUCME|nr:fatty-acid-binding protein 3, chloroplastic [Cucumis melo]KAA0064310.1 fatty-acid-binding protein 3 [Cucumis melo var. makuwa]TYK20276.1 fatty-acid-binding protein 3 [Cucumis melo var. makuwa]